MAVVHRTVVTTWNPEDGSPPAKLTVKRISDMARVAELAALMDAPGRGAPVGLSDFEQFQNWTQLYELAVSNTIAWEGVTEDTGEALECNEENKRALFTLCQGATLAVVLAAIHGNLDAERKKKSSDGSGSGSPSPTLSAVKDGTQKPESVSAAQS